MTNSYSELRRQIEELEKQAAKVRESEINEAKKKIQEIMATYGLSISDISVTKKIVVERKSVEVKYRGPNGEEWTGRGRAPRWLEGKNKEDYLIK